MLHPSLVALVTLVIAFDPRPSPLGESPVIHQVAVILKQLLVIVLLRLLAAIAHSYLIQGKGNLYI